MIARSRHDYDRVDASIALRAPFAVIKSFSGLTSGSETNPILAIEGCRALILGVDQCNRHSKRARDGHAQCLG
ncbi:hypothetical protein CAL25_23730 [Bordetella genomosp. 5]|uniref:Uncharacterized protein n=1 Tax=Bordetella genomosp. 5 TaxID=1395608 RepID=A0A261SZW2_9BORD|nr:hypothetical protein CAL25_23730 [Bordetella genomosp. 5]